MLQIDNSTPFEACLAVLPDPEGVDTLFTTVKGTFRMDDPSEPAEEQVPLLYGDEHWGDPAASSIRRPHDVHLTKPNTDVLVLGHARPEGGGKVTELDVSVRVGALSMRMRVTGDRTWKSGLLSAGITAPEPFEAMPLVWERAFGGTHVVDEAKNKVLYEARNPVGCGFTGKRGSKDLGGLALPNLEHPDRRVRKPGQKCTPVCFAPIAAAWAPRVEYAGTYDEAWQKARAPFLPADFDARFFNVAPADLVADGYLRGDEAVELDGVSKLGRRSFHLPGVGVRTTVRIAGEDHAPPANLETVILEPDQERVCLVWRSAVRCDKRALQVERVAVEAAEALAGAAGR